MPVWKPGIDRSLPGDYFTPTFTANDLMQLSVKEKKPGTNKE
jgi:hypothetical protein